MAKENEQKVKLDLENEKTQEKLNTFEPTRGRVNENKRSLSMKLNVIFGQMLGMPPQWSKTQSILSLAGHQVIRNLSEPSEFTSMHLDTYADYLRQIVSRIESRTGRALLTAGPRGSPRKRSRCGCTSA